MRYPTVFVVCAVAGALALTPACDKGKTEAASAPATTKPAAEAPAKKAAETPTPAKAPAAKPAADTPVEPTKAAAPAPAAKPAAKPAPPGGQATLAEAKALADEMATEIQKVIVASQMAKGDKAKLDEIGKRFKTLNEEMTAKMERVQERMSPEDLAQFEVYAKEKLQPLVGALLQAFFTAGGLQPTGDAKPGEPQKFKLDPSKVQPTPPPTQTKLQAAKAQADAYARELQSLVDRVEAAAEDKAKLDAIMVDYKSMGVEFGNVLGQAVATLDESDKKAFEAYAEGRLRPMAEKLMGAFVDAGVTPDNAVSPPE